MRRGRAGAWPAIGTLVGSVVLAGCAATPPAVPLTKGPGPAKAYDCAFDAATEAYTGADATASAIGWEGNRQGVVTCLGGTFFVQDGLETDYGFGIYAGAPTTWVDADGYLPAQVTTFDHGGATVSITEFADRLVLGGDAYVAVYSRVAVSNPTDQVVAADPEASSGMVELHAAPDVVAPHASVHHDYVVAVDRFGNQYPWPSSEALAGAGSFDRHFAHMRAFWVGQLSQVAGLALPDAALVDAYRSGFISMQIARHGDDLDSGVNGYQSEYSHDVVGILADLFTEGYFTDAQGLLLEAGDVVGSQDQYVDGEWTYPWPWAIYLLKTGNVAFVKAHFAADGLRGGGRPSIEGAAHAIAADRTGPSGIMESTDDIDTQGYWTTDDYEALLGLAAYHYIAERIGNRGQADWATQEYDSLLSATSRTLGATIAHYGLGYLPCSILQPNTANRCANPEDANWASPFSRWAWDGSLFGATLSGPGATMIDATYAYGFGRLAGVLPPDTFGGFPDDWYSSGYNAGYGGAGLAASAYRDQGILGYEFLIDHDQSGPNSWWESSSAPSATTPWVGDHPATGQGSSPHAWGISQANKVLLDSLVAQRSDGALVVGRGVPARWLGPGMSISVTNFPATDGRRLGLTMTSTGRAVTLELTGSAASGAVLFQLPAFTDDMAGTSAGTIDEASGTVTLPAGTRTVTVELRTVPAP